MYWIFIICLRIIFYDMQYDYSLINKLYTSNYNMYIVIFINCGLHYFCYCTYLYINKSKNCKHYENCICAVIIPRLRYMFVAFLKHLGQNSTPPSQIEGSIKCQKTWILILSLIACYKCKILSVYQIESQNKYSSPINIIHVQKWLVFFLIL